MRSGFSLVGLLISLVCVVVLFTIGMNAMNKAVTGQGSAQENTVRSFEDKVYLYAMYQSMVAHASDHNGRFVAPSMVTGRDDIERNTTANLFSLMVMQRYIEPKQLISGNEYNNWIVEDEDYDYLAYQPRDGVYWDPTFEGDLERGSNVSFAHVPLYGERYRKHWNADMTGRFPILGNRGPRNGVADPGSYTYGRNGEWAGHLVYGDGHIEFEKSFTPGGITFRRDGQAIPDNVFSLQDGEDGDDAILSFTQQMTTDGPLLQFD